MRKIHLVPIIMSALVMAGCSNVSAMQQKGYEDKEFLTSDSCSYTYQSKVGNVDSESAELEFKGFSGNDYLWYVDASEDTQVECTGSINVNKGDFKIIAVSEDKELTTVWENIESDNNENNIIIDVPEGRNVIKIVGRKSSGDINLRIVSGDSYTVLVPRV